MDHSIHQEKLLFRQIAAGDEAAFETLFYLYLPLIQPVVLNMVKSEAAVKDLVQEIFLQVWMARDKLEAIDSPPHWIFRIVYNRTLTWLEQQSVREKAKDKMSAQQGQAFSRHTEETVSFAETARLVQQAIRQLPPQAQKIYLLSRESGLKAQEIATELNLSVQTVKNTLGNAGRSIKEYLAQQGIVLPLVLFSYWSH